ncbi:peroxidase family protein [Pseudomonas sp. MBLB4136]|uniref:peroxidase family protein n=1 Tax=Pseudomonas sp. MBLB4136 TaxID=3451558 RepID=UPI003F7549E4
MANFIKSDLEFILQQILIAEGDANGEDILSLLPNTLVPFGLRTVDGSNNNLLAGQTEFGAADNLFPRMLDPVFRPAEMGTSYTQTSGMVIDSQPRTISNLIVDQTITNPAAVQAFVDAGMGVLADGSQLDGGGVPFPIGTLLDLEGNEVPAGQSLFIPNTAPDEGLSAPFNSWFIFFGQFFDHGLDLVQKGGNGLVFMPLQPDDPLITHGPDGVAGTGDELIDPALQFMVLPRATNQPGPDGILGTADDVHEHLNQTSPFVDQNQTYSSHPSHQVFLRAYELNADGKPVSTGRLINNRDLGPDGEFGTADDVLGTGMATWAVVKAQARALLGIDLTDADVTDIPLLATDAYGKFIPGVNGFPQVVMLGADGLPGTADDFLVEGDPLAPISLTGAVRTGQAFLVDIAHAANPIDSQTGDMLAADSDSAVGLSEPGTFDNELLDAHFITGDGRVNENIGLTAIHHVFHSEHNRLVELTKDVAIEAANAGDLDFLNQWLLTPVAAVPADLSTLVWNGERLFQAAKFGTEMQYQHLVFEEFARKVQPQVDEFLAPDGFDITIDPSIVAEFAHTVYRFGHSMLTETVNRLDPNFVSSDMGLIEAFLNPLAFNQLGGVTVTAEQAAGALVRGLTRQAGNEVDEFVTGALRNNLLGLPLDLPAINIARGRDTGVPSLNAARRSFYEATGDSQLKPYTSWVDLLGSLKHELSLINFIAAYGTHSTITSASTLADKRAAAMELVFGVDENGDSVISADRLDFLHGTGDWANNADGVTITGVDAIDFWVGGLAEAQMPFGGLLGSTFNFVFETQMEALQSGDRFYYLGRLAGLNFLTEMEDNSFAKLVMRHTDALHLPADIFSTPGLILEADQSRQFNEGLGMADPVGEDPLIPLVMRDDPGTEAVETNYLHYTGDEHVVLGGTDGDDTLISSIGDDTLWGDGGNDRLEGGDGNDVIEGGDGDDIITDMGGDDVLKGNDGNDVIQGGNGENLILGGHGKDFIITGEDVSETFAGPGDDFIYGAPLNLPTFGNEGDDWIELGTSDGAAGDNFDPQAASTILGHDVFITGGGFDEVDGEGGDDIMMGSEGEDHFSGGGGFDWVGYKFARFGVSVDMLVNDLIEPPVAASNQGILDRFVQVEGLFGSAEGDILRGDHSDATTINVDGVQNSTLNAAGIALIDGLQAFLDAMLAPGTSSFSGGNIILGGGGSDIIEGRGGDDLIDGERTLNVRISVRENTDGTGVEIASFDSMKPMIPLMLNGTYNPGQLVIVREILLDPDSFDTAVFTGNFSSLDPDLGVVLEDYVISRDDKGTADFSDDVFTVIDTFIDGDGIDHLRGIERLQFNDVAFVRDDTTGEFVAQIAGTQQFGNWSPDGLIQVSGTVQVGQVLTASVAGITDGDNAGGTLDGRPISYIWQVDTFGDGIFEDIVALGGGNPVTQLGNTFRVTPDLEGLALRVKAIYRDDLGTTEMVFSAGTAPVAAGVFPTPAAIPAESAVVSPGGGLHLIRSDLQFILEQIFISEQHAAGADLLSLLPNSRVPFGLRTVDGSFNNLVQGQSGFGATDEGFPFLLEQQFRDDMDGDSFDINGPAPGGEITNTNYASTTDVADADPRIISNLIADQTITNPSAVQAFLDAGLGTQMLDAVTGDPLFNVDGTPRILDLDGVEIPRGQTLILPNTAPDEGLSAPFNAWFTFFGQFFDHGLDLVQKGGNGNVFVPLQPDDPLITHGADGIAGTGDELTNPAQQFMLLTRATNVDVQPGADGVLGTSDDIHIHNNQTSPFVDQNQTYASHPAHQVFLRAYALNGASQPVATGELITNRDVGVDGIFGTADDMSIGGMATWAIIKAQARDILGIELSDHDALNVPLVAVDPYGNFIPGPNGRVQLVTDLGPDGLLGTADDVLVEGDPLAPVSPAAVGALRTGHSFLVDIAHAANPFDAQTGAPLMADSDDAVGLSNGVDPVTGDPISTNGFFDNELLEAHFIAGDGRVNENIALTSVHHVFHSEHNRVVAHTKDVVLASNDVDFINNWLLTPIVALPTTQVEIDALEWNGERLFHVAKFTTEMEYQHLVFEEFARKIQPQVDVFLGEGQGYDGEINPAIVAEFAHAVYRFGHTMLLETVDRLDPNYASSEVGLIQAFLNPLEFSQNGTLTPEEAAGAIVRGVTRQAGNEIDNFVTEALRNNLLGLPLDLPAINIARARDTGTPSLNAARRDFWENTGDSQLTPYSSWVDFAMNMRHPTSLVNFIAAYGTHAELLAVDVDTLAEKRAVAAALVLGGSAVINAGELDERTFVADDVDRIAFLNSTGIYAMVGGITTTGVDDIDLWVGGLAERQMPFGGMLGSTFNFVFENQLEKLQNGDRFYYLERTAGLNFLSELENNSFARMIMANTDATHLPGDVFSTPGFILEVDQSRQFTGLDEAGLDGIQGTADDEVGADGIAGNSDPLGGALLTPDVIRDNPDTPGGDTNYLRYTGDEHIVLGGTAADDILVSSIGDDTLHGDQGNDRLEGGDGNDIVLGGDGDDILTDQGGEDNMQGGDGHDAIHGGNSIDLILGGFGNDFIVTGEDSDETFGGPGNDFILGDIADEFVLGNEGDDWLELGMADGSSGDNFDVRGLDATIGNDVFVGGGSIDRMGGEGGDDIMMGNGGPTDRYIGGSGFDWAVFKDDPAGAYVDMRLRAFDEVILPPSNGTVLARFESMEGLSGSAHSDILLGDDFDAGMIAASGFNGSVLTNIALIDGLQGFLDGMLGTPTVPTVTTFGAGNIILGGDGSDLLQGNGGDDLIDGDLWLNVRISVRENADGSGAEIRSANSMTELVDDVFAGLINPGQLVIVREILPSDGSFNFDTATYSGPLANYTIVENANGTFTVTDNGPDGLGGVEGTDTLRNIERLQFNDQSVVLVPGLNAEAVGLASINDNNPEVGSLLSANVDTVTDADNPGLGRVTGPVSYQWQADFTGTGVYEDIVAITALGDERANNQTFRVTDDLAGLTLRVKAIYKDANGVLETVFSAVTGAVAAVSVNDAPVGTMLISDTTPNVGQLLTASRAFTDPDGPVNPTLSYQWQAGTGGVFNNILGATAASFTPSLALTGQALRVVVSYTDDLGNLETVTSLATAAVVNLIAGTTAGDVLNGTEFDDEIQGLAGDDILNGLAGNDVLEGGIGNDRLDGGADNDVLDGGADNDILIGGSGDDAMFGGAGNDIYAVTDAGDVVVELAGQGTDTVWTSLANYTLTANVENLTYSGVDDFSGTGNALANVIRGGIGNDSIVGGGAADTLIGGAGNDSYAVTDVGDVVVELAGEGTDTVWTSLLSYTLGANVERLAFSGSGNFTGVGNALNNWVVGGIGNDSIIGGAGNDTLIGGAGNDIYAVTDMGDVIIELADGGTDTVWTSLSSYTLTVNVENLTYSGVGNFSGTGNALANVIRGGVGNDVIVGGAGADTMYGGAGNDIYAVTDAGDVVVELAGRGSDTVWTSLLSYTLTANVENLTYSGTGNFSGTGNALANVIRGGVGNDTLTGGAGNDTLVGGQGNDIFMFGPGFGNDIITDFDADPVGGQDLLNIAALGVTAATFAASVTIADAGADTLVSVGGGTIRLVGINDATTITQMDFTLAV